MDSLDLCNGIRMESEGVVENNIPLDWKRRAGLTPSGTRD